MGFSLSGTNTRAPGRDEISDTGLFVYNRIDMSFDEMTTRRADPRNAWTPGDLFAVFRDELGEVRVQYSRFEDFSAVALTELVRSRRGFEKVEVDKQTLVHLVGLLMISRLHNYHFDNFMHLLDHDGVQIFDLRGLCEWIAANEELFLSDAESVVEEDADDVEGNQALYDSLSSVAA